MHLEGRGGGVSTINGECQKGGGVSTIKSEATFSAFQVQYQIGLVRELSLCVVTLTSSYNFVQ